MDRGTKRQAYQVGFLPGSGQIRLFKLCLTVLEEESRIDLWMEVTSEPSLEIFGGEFDESDKYGLGRYAEEGSARENPRV